MKNRLFGIIAATLLAAAPFAHAGDAEIPSFRVAGSDWNTQIMLTNVSAVTADVAVTLWDGNGNRLTNFAMSSGQSTDANGQYVFSLPPRNTHRVYLHYSHISSYTEGNAKISVSSLDPNEDSSVYLVGDVVVRSVNTSYGYAVNNGQPF